MAPQVSSHDAAAGEPESSGDWTSPQGPSAQLSRAAANEAAVGTEGGRETEIKFRTDPAGLKLALESASMSSCAAPRTQTLRSIYFDTASGDLRRNGMLLRVRKKGRAAPVLGIKSAPLADGSPFQRREIEVRSRGLEPDISLFDEKTAGELTRIVGNLPLEPKFETQVRRRVATLHHGGSAIEVAFDEGHVIAGERRVPLVEVELELKSGDEADLCDLAAGLARDLPLRLDFVSKSDRGFRAVGGQPPAAVKAGKLALAPEATLDSAVAAVISHTLAQFVANWAALRETEQPESIHQMRVALRRMRSALAMFKRALPCAEFDSLRADAKRIATVLGEARDCDVFRDSVETGPLADGAGPAGSDLLMAAVGRRRKTAYDRARGLIDGRDATLFVLAVQSFLARRPWRNGLASEELPQLSLPLADFASQALDRLHGRALKRGKKLSELSDERRHELRIALKNLRYGADFFAGVFHHQRRARSYVASVATLQDLLGAHNDVVTARHFLDTLSAEMGPAGDRACGYILGWQARGGAIADRGLRKAWKTFKNAPTFWH